VYLLLSSALKVLPMARRKEAHGGGHGWFVTFADLMGLLVSFFVMLVAFSSQDSQKVAALAGSMRDAFGEQTRERFSGVLEIDGLSTRTYIKNAAHIPPQFSSVTPTPDDKGHSPSTDKILAQAAVSLRQALQEFPELTEASKRITIEESKEGLDIDLVDQDGRSMFPKGSSVPYDRTRTIIQKLAGPLKATPYRISITGHTSADESDGGHKKWALAIDRANVVRQILEEEGYLSGNFFDVGGKADTDPVISDDPTVAANRRITITLIREAPPVPPGLQP
jgi:chemotaxis protein MotB